MGRLDLELVARGLARSRSQAQALISAGQVKVDGEVIRRAVAARAARSSRRGPHRPVRLPGRPQAGRRPG